MLSSSGRHSSLGHRPGAVSPVTAIRAPPTVCGVPSGTVVLEAQYDYGYRGADGKPVCIREGERFILLKKTNSDWWQVRRIGAASKTKPIYVPATYVTEVPIKPMPSPQRLVSSTSLNANLSIPPRLSITPSPTERKYKERNHANKSFCRSMENLTSNSALRGMYHFPALPLSGSTFSSQSDTKSCLLVSRSSAPHTAAPTTQRVVPTITRSRSSSNLPDETMPENPYDEVSDGICSTGGGGGGQRTCSGMSQKSSSHWDVADASRRTNRLQLSWQDSPLYTDVVEEPAKKPPSSPSSSSSSQLEPPTPAPGQKPLQVMDLWEQYSDPATGRYYYVNSFTQERSWKPPRRSALGRGSSKASEIKPQTLPRDTSHLSLPLSGNHNGTMHRLSPDFLFGSHSRTAGSGWQTNQSMQRAVSSETLASQHCGRQQLSHSQSMILPENGKVVQQCRDCSYVTDIIVEPPSPIDSSPDSDGCTPELEKAGLLNKTKIAEGGRKLRKNWNPSWVVLVGNSLVFFKDPKSQTPNSWKPGNSRPESSVDLRGARIQWANELSSKKNVFKLRTVTGNEFLLQSETDSLIREWYNTIQSVIDKLDRDNPLDNVLLYSLRRAGSVEMLEEDEDDRCRTSTLPRSASNLENTERKRVKSRLKKLILKRPPLQALQEKGLIKDQVFGCRLEMLCERERNTVPRFVRLCTQAVEKRGLETDGIYRVSGNLAVIQKLRYLVNHEEKLNLDQSEWEDVHVITGALKLFFRELPEPLVPYGFFTDIVETVKMSDYQDKVDRLKCLVLNMPPPNHDTMQFMFQHLRRVMEHSDVNRMTTQNIGIVFGPTVMRPERDNGNMAINMVYQNRAVELILNEFHYIFGTGSSNVLL